MLSIIKTPQSDHFQQKLSEFQPYHIAIQSESVLYKYYTVVGPKKKTGSKELIHNGILSKISRRLLCLDRKKKVISFMQRPFQCYVQHDHFTFSYLLV